MLDLLVDQFGWVQVEHVYIIITCMIVNWFMMYYYINEGARRANKVVEDARSDMTRIRSEIERYRNEIERYRSEIDRYRAEIDRHRDDTDRLHRKIEVCSAFIPKDKVDDIF